MSTKTKPATTFQISRDDSWITIRRHGRMVWAGPYQSFKASLADGSLRVPASVATRIHGRFKLAPEINF